MFTKKASLSTFGRVNKEGLNLKKMVYMHLVLTQSKSYTQRYQHSLLSLAKFLKISKTLCYFKEKIVA